MVEKLFLVLLLIHCTIAQAAPINNAPKKWSTLNGGEPLVVARGGFSGLFPDSSSDAYAFANQTSLPDVSLYCDLQLTKDGVGICMPQLRLDNITVISQVFPNRKSTYNVNGEEVEGWFALDFTAKELLDQVYLIQNIYSRPSVFDGVYPIMTPDMVTSVNPRNFWLNVQYDTFYTHHKLPPGLFVEDSLMDLKPSYISSPEIGFLKYMDPRLNRRMTKLIFRFQDKEAVEPTTKEKYGSLLEKLPIIKEFANGILVPKEYIWPVTTNLVLEPSTGLVQQAHKLGLEVYASGFASDFSMSYNYSYDPIAEYVKYVGNPEFSVDGILTDFPGTASEAIACFADDKNSTKKTINALVISHNGASGDFPGSTDLAYQKAIADGADIIDCSVQMTQDGIPFCLDSADLSTDTTAALAFMDRSSTVPEIQQNSGIFSFDLTWSEIQTVKPQIVNPYMKAGLFRNPANKNKGKFVTLADFLELAKQQAVTGVLINIQNAAYLASEKGLDITTAVATALSNATFDKQSTQKVMIQSDDSSVLSTFKDIPTYTRVLSVPEIVSGAANQTAKEIKEYADAIVVDKLSLISQDAFSFTISSSGLIQEMHAENISVYVGIIRNEFMSLAFDYFDDPYVQLATLVSLQVDGFVTEFPASANAFTRNRCSDLNANVPFYIYPIHAGDMLQLIPPGAQAPAQPPAPVLEADAIVDPPLPPVSNTTAAASNSTASTSTATASPPRGSSNSQASNLEGFGFIVMALVVTVLLGFN